MGYARTGENFDPLKLPEYHKMNLEIFGEIYTPH